MFDIKQVMATDTRYCCYDRLDFRLNLGSNLTETPKNGVLRAGRINNKKYPCVAKTLYNQSYAILEGMAVYANILG